MKTILIILGAIVAAGGLVLLIVSPVLGLIFAALGIAFIVYGIKYKKKPVNDPASAPDRAPVSAPVREPVKHTILVAGFDYRQDALRPLLVERNPIYDGSVYELLDYYQEDEQIFEYERAVYPLHIQAEPDNPYDPNAIKVLAGDVFIGYVPRGAFAEIKECMTHDPVCSVEVFGGRYKYLEYDYEADYLGEFDPKFYRIRTDSTPVKAVMVFQWV